ncbi:hypothetical protein FEAC_10920 [Ferrimicrobium acidiphilum DSM 19497]|uniref:Uncharacterized protein n=1 Tax=Ferrimicrobium acidiphilum DSM 19497 TaxID=1121877 RepID=A0A0D8FY08_9ACTN|nr:hypothetical protein FEAC_10920 [Ferrimicrobium acidiphilum DSM 19497]
MVVQNSVTFSVTQIGSQVGRSKAIDYPGWTQLMLLSSKTVRHMSSVHHNWSLLKSDRFDEGW